jgi:hypothetical protein
MTRRIKEVEVARNPQSVVAAEDSKIEIEILLLLLPLQLGDGYMVNIIVVQVAVRRSSAPWMIARPPLSQ